MRARLEDALKAKEAQKAARDGTFPGYHTAQGIPHRMAAKESLSYYIAL